MSNTADAQAATTILGVEGHFLDYPAFMRKDVQHMKDVAVMQDIIIPKPEKVQLHIKIPVIYPKLNNVEQQMVELKYYDEVVGAKAAKAKAKAKSKGSKAPTSSSAADLSLACGGAVVMAAASLDNARADRQIKTVKMVSHLLR